MAIYDRRFGLQQNMVDYLNQALPDISGIFRSRTPGPSIPTPVPVAPEPVAPEPGLTPEQLRLLYPQNVGGGDDDFRGGGAFGNLDLSRSKTVVRDVYDEELGDFIPTELTGYYNPKLGNFQTLEGKNLTPAFSNTGMRPGIIDLGLNLLGIENKTVGGFVPGSIRGIYDSPMDLIKRNRNEDPGMTPAQITRRKKGLESMSKVYQDIGGNRDDRPDRGVSQTKRDAGPGFSGSGSAAEMGSF